MTLGTKPPQPPIPFVTPMERISKLKAIAREHWKRRCLVCGIIFDTSLHFQEHMFIHDLVNACYLTVCEDDVTKCELPKFDDQSGSRNDTKNSIHISNGKLELLLSPSNNQPENDGRTKQAPNPKRRKTNGHF
uniref:C2H2-type domain-containing protein n=1 Tax=Rhabditophanes sp. KR3021 TaxID=114890 RepID=A0AC35TWP2_9BILA